MKILIGVLANDEGGYGKMVEACRETCYSDIPDDVEVFYIYGRRAGVETPDDYRLEGDCFYNNSSESRNNLIYKTISFFEYCYHNLDFDYIFRTNCGSYVDLNILKSEIQNLPKENVYYGIESFVKNIKYASGSGFLLSRDVVKFIVEKRQNILLPGQSGFVMDDVSIGKLLTQEAGLKVLPGAKRKNLILSEILDEKFQIDEECYHYYFRHSIEPKCLYELHKKKVGLEK